MQAILQTILWIGAFLSALASIRACMTVCRKVRHFPRLPTPPAATPTPPAFQYPRICYKCRLNWASTFKYCQKDEMNYVACSDAEVQSTYNALSRYEKSRNLDLGVTKIRSNFACIYGYLPEEIMFQDWYLENKLGDHREFQFVYQNYSWKGTGINGCVYDTFKMKNSFPELKENYTHKIAIEREKLCQANCDIRFSPVELWWTEFCHPNVRPCRTKYPNELAYDIKYREGTIRVCKETCKRPNTKRYAKEQFTEIGICNQSFCNNVSPFKKYTWNPASHKKRTFLGCVQLDKKYNKRVFMRTELMQHDCHQGVVPWHRWYQWTKCRWWGTIENHDWWKRAYQELNGDLDQEWGYAFYREYPGKMFNRDFLWSHYRSFRAAAGEKRKQYPE